MDKKSLLAIVLSVLILILYQEITSYLYPPVKKTAPVQPAEPVTPAVSPASQAPTETGQAKQVEPAPPAVAQVTAPAERAITVENEVYTAVLTSRGGRLKSLRLKNYPGDAGRDSPPLEMVKEGPLGELPLAVRLEGKGSAIGDDAMPYEVSGGDIHLHGSEQATVEFKGKTANGTLITKAFSFSGQTYGMTLTVKIEGAPETISFVSLLWARALEHQKNSSYQVHGPVALIERKFVYEAAASVEGKEKILGPGHIRWGGYADTYFLAAMVPPDGDMHRLVLSATNGTIETKLTIPWRREPVTYTLYTGPKEFEALNAVHPALDRAIDFGWFHFIARPLVSVLKFSYSLTGNYGIDIILLTFMVKLAFFPLSNKSFKSMSEMRKLQPQMERLREQYKDDRERLNKETMELY
ncbi:MAG: membrane protein insertase YidC, partial [Deltaproteobacteria bacterium]|nr:membrane protein insertase YidC [Deltaproteobacteria bacterium]